MGWNSERVLAMQCNAMQYNTAMLTTLFRSAPEVVSILGDDNWNKAAIGFEGAHMTCTMADILSNA